MYEIIANLSECEHMAAIEALQTCRIGTSNLNAEIVGSAYTHITIITLLHLLKIIILTLILRGRLICVSANMSIYGT